MNRHKTPSRYADAPVAVDMFVVSDDGYLRLSFDQLKKIPLSHLISGLDGPPPATVSDAAMAMEITGYTEWVSSTFPTITLGWDWEMDGECSLVHLSKLGTPRSNIMLTDGVGKDLGTSRTKKLLDELIDALDWPHEVQGQLEIRYRD